MSLSRMVEQFLAWLAAMIAPQLAPVDVEPAKAAAAVAFAAASMTRDAGPMPPPAPPEPDDGKCCSDCGGTGWVVQPDGHRTPCPCPDSCECKRRQSGQADCPRCLGLGVVGRWTDEKRWVEPCNCSKQ